MPFDQHRNLAISSVAVAPDPPHIGNTLRIQWEHVNLWPPAPFNVTIWTYGTIPTIQTAEVARVTAINGNEFTIDRAQETTFARMIEVGDLIAETITAKALQDIESGTNFPLITTSGAITSATSVNAPVGDFDTVNAGTVNVSGNVEVDGNVNVDGNVTATQVEASSVTAGQGTFTEVHATSVEATASVSAPLGQFGGLGTTPINPANIVAPIPDAKLSVNVLKHTGGYPGGTANFLRADGTFAATPINGGIPALHAPTHAQGGTDPVDVKGLTGYPGGTTQFLRADKTFATPTGNAPGLHAPTHAIGGSDPVVKTFRTSHTWGVLGDLTAITVLPSFFVDLVAPQTTKIVSIVGRIVSGTSISAQVRVNGANVGTPILMVPTRQGLVLNQTLAVNDEVTVLLSAPVGTPTTLSATVNLEHTV